METLIDMTFLIVMMTFLIVMMISSIVIMSSSDYGPDNIKKKLKVPVKITNEYAVIYFLETKYFIPL